MNPRCGHHQPPAHPLQVCVGTVRDVLVCRQRWSPNDSSRSGRCLLFFPKAVLAGQVCALGEFFIQRIALGDGVDMTIDVNEIVGMRSFAQISTEMVLYFLKCICLNSSAFSQSIHIHPANFITD